MLPYNLFDLCAFQMFGSVPRDKNNVPSAAADRCNFPVCRLDNSAAAVALHGATQLFPGCYANTANTRAVFQYIGHQRRICLRFASPVGPAEVAVLLKRNYIRQSNQSVRSRVLKTRQHTFISMKASSCPLPCGGQEPCGRFCRPFFYESRVTCFCDAFWVDKF